jgi:1,2-phenylacetyl-CoA epoxidase catalytic subunit
VLEKTDHAERVLTIMGTFGADTGRYATHHPWAARVARNAELSAERRAGDMRLSVFHYPLNGWTDAVTMNALMGLATVIQVKELSRVSYAPLAEAFRAIAPREGRHAELGLEGLEELARSPAGRAGAEAAITYWRPRVAATFGNPGSNRFQVQKQFGLRHTPNEELLKEWLDLASQRFGALGLNFSA